MELMTSPVPPGSEVRHHCKRSEHSSSIPAWFFIVVPAPSGYVRAPPSFSAPQPLFASASLWAGVDGRAGRCENSPRRHFGEQRPCAASRGGKASSLLGYELPRAASPCKPHGFLGTLPLAASLARFWVFCDSLEHSYPSCLHGVGIRHLPTGL